MPIYQLAHSGVPLNLFERDRLAKGITEIHHSETGAPEPFVRVVFTPLPLGTIYTAGEISPSVLLSCGIRAGRSEATRHKIIRRCYDLVADVTQLPPDQIFVIVEEAPSSWIMEAGFFLPEPTDEAEAAWIKQLQKAYPGQYDEWGSGGKRPASTVPGAGHAAELLKLAEEMVEQAKRDGADAAEVLGPLGKLVTQELGTLSGAVSEALGAARQAAAAEGAPNGTHAKGTTAGRASTGRTSTGRASTGGSRGTASRKA